MKNLIAALVIGSVFVSSFTYANSKDEKTILKSRQIVEASTPDDWKALAEAASICVKEKTNLTQAAEWLDKSLAIKLTAFNLEVKGDYMLLSNQSDKAMAFYIKAMHAGLNNEPGFDVKNLQTKIAKLRESKSL